MKTGSTTAIFGDVPVNRYGWTDYIHTVTMFSLEVASLGGYRLKCFWLDWDEPYEASTQGGVPWSQPQRKPKATHVYLPGFK